MHDLSPLSFMVTMPNLDEPISSPLYKFIQKEGPVAFAAFKQQYNSILDSGCTNHIFCDRSVFWTYDPERAVSVQTVNCGALCTLAHGDVKFRVQCGSDSIVVTLRNCLHAPDVPLNLLSVGALQERRMKLVFEYDKTTIHFPINSPLAHLYFVAKFYRCLSFLPCDFILLPMVLGASANFALPVFPHIELTPDCWHWRFGHLGRDATYSTKDRIFLDHT